jgi:dolichol-phosphate mannosyltransferase
MDQVYNLAVNLLGQNLIPNYPVYLSVVLPAFNEETVVAISIPNIIEEITNSSRFYYYQFDFEIIVVDDGSKDRTLEKLLDLKSSYPFVRILRMTGNHGHMQALEAGLQCAIGKYVITMDIDLQDPPSYIGQMIHMAESENLECVQTIRKDRMKDTFMKRFTASIFYKFMKILTGVQVIPHAGDYRLLTNEVVKEIISSPEIHKIFRFLIPSMNLDMKTLEIVRDERISGKSKYPYIKMIAFAVDSVFGFSKRPLRIISLVGLVTSAVLIAGTAVTFSLWIFFGAVPGWAPLILFSLSSNALILAALGVTGEYIARIYVQTVGRSTLRYKEIIP